MLFLKSLRVVCAEKYCVVFQMVVLSWNYKTQPFFFHETRLLPSIMQTAVISQPQMTGSCLHGTINLEDTRARDYESMKSSAPDEKR